MAKVLVVYDSKYGNTKRVAEKIAEGLKEVEGIEYSIGYAKQVKLSELDDFDAVLIGAPNHMGKPSRTIRKFVDDLAKLDLKAKQFAVFDTYFARPRNFEKAMKKLENLIKEKMPSWKPMDPGLSIKVTNIVGPVAEGEFAKCVDFGKRIAHQLRE